MHVARTRKNLKGLGSFDWLGAASSLISGDGGLTGGGSGAGAPANQVSVNPNINVNPQISPVFQQQFQPTNSPIAAGTSQGAPSGGGLTGGGAPFTPSAPVVPAVPNAPINWNKYLMYGGIGILALFAFKLMNKKRAPVRRARTRAKTTPTIRRRK